MTVQSLFNGMPIALGTRTLRGAFARLAFETCGFMCVVPVAWALTPVDAPGVAALGSMALMFITVVAIAQTPRVAEAWAYWTDARLEVMERARRVRRRLVLAFALRRAVPIAVTGAAIVVGCLALAVLRDAGYDVRWEVLIALGITGEIFWRGRRLAVATGDVVADRRPDVALVAS